MRWREALEEDVAPQVILDACHENSLNFVSIRRFAEIRFRKIRIIYPQNERG